MATPKLKSDEDDEEETADDEEEVEEEQEEEAEEEQQENEEQEEEVEVAEVQRPGDEDEDESGGSLSGTTFGISNKFLLAAGIGAALLVVYLKFIRSRSTTTEEFEPEQAEEEIEEAVDEKPDSEVQIERSDSDPLQADEQAMDHIFADQQ